MSSSHTRAPFCWKGDVRSADTLFETERLLVRRLDLHDLEALHAVYGDADAMRWVGDGKPLDRDACRRWIDVTLRNYEERGYGMSAVVSRASHATIGFCGLVHPNGQTEPELKYALAREHWDNGFASELAHGMLRYGADRFAMKRIIATVAPEHVVSLRVLAKAGMRPVERRRNVDGTETCVFEWRAS
jgi:RimJ/RimL family protein N-acetyltransferase